MWNPCCGPFESCSSKAPGKPWKTTLARDLLNLPDDAWFSLDNEAVLNQAVNDFVGSSTHLQSPQPSTMVERAGQGLILVIKTAADHP